MSQKKFTAILGLGKTGLSCARFFSERGEPFVIMDDRADPPELKTFQQSSWGASALEIVTGKFSEKLLNAADEIVVSPGISLKHPLIAQQIAQGKSVIGDIELFARTVKKPVIAITGANGKTTVTTLVGLMVEKAGFRASVCGNIGEPVLSHIADPCDYYVLELSSFQLETTYSLGPVAATILNITPDHMDRYADLQEYVRAKQRVYRHCKTAIVNADEPEIWRDALLQHPNIYSFGLHPSADFSIRKNKKQSDAVLVYQGKSLLRVSELKLQAQYHLQNALAALALGGAIQLPMETMLSTLRQFGGIRHRCQWIRQHAGVDYYNDSKGTNTGATQAALISLGSLIKGRIILIAGGQGKNADFSPLRDLLKRYVKAVILIGQDADHLEKIFQDVTTIHRAITLEEAVLSASAEATAGDIVLLSPACASFDMFTNFEARGDAFIKAVQAL